MEIKLADIIQWIITAILAIITFIKRESFTKGREAVRSELIDKHIDEIPELINRVEVLERNVESFKEKFADLIKRQESFSDRLYIMEKTFSQQDSKLANLEKMLEKVMLQSSDFHESLTESSKAIHSLHTSVDGLKSLLEKIIDGKLIIRKEKS